VTYAIIDVNLELAGAPAEREEPLGTKEKFWFLRDGGRWLFKYCRPGTGEDWAERIAAEIAQLLRLPHADVELATFNGHRGVVVRDFTVGGELALVHGNELLLEADPTYPANTGSYYQVSAHTVASIAAALTGIRWAQDKWLRSGVEDSLDLFVGYLMLDALIGNTDRHHENWGVLIMKKDTGPRFTVLAPTYDHASSLGRELRADVRQRKYGRRDGSYDVAKFIGKARSATYAAPTEKAPLSPLSAFRAFAALRPVAAKAWLGALAALTNADLANTVDRIPHTIMSGAERDFARAILAYTRLQLLETDDG
jgi:hypothetical protein